MASSNSLNTTSYTTGSREIINTDTYNIANSINGLAKSYIPEMTEDTLSVGLPGFIIALETMKLKNNAIMTGALSNEVFPQRALLDRNIITHAIMEGITGINATPSHMTVVIGILENDFLKYATGSSAEGYKLVLDKYCPINIENTFNFYLDYDIILKRSKSSTGNYVYSATYDLPQNKNEYNRISYIDNPYAKQPYITKVGESNYIFIQTTLHQVSIDRKYSTFITSNVIDNRTIVFEFDEEQQLADFEVKVTEPGKKDPIYLTPVFEGAALDTDIDKYCEYTYINTNTIRISFIRASYMPRLNSTVEIIVKTTLGSAGIFTYDNAAFVNFASSEHGYPQGIQVLIRPNSASTGGIDRKSIEELHTILPKEILMNGAITTETDLTNYFNLINTDTEKMIMMKKSDSQIERVYYAYMLLKNSMGNVVPTNTITIDIPDTELPIITEDGDYILPAGSIIIYDYENKIGKITHNPDDPAIKKSRFVYMMLYTIEITIDPLYASFFMTVVNQNPYASYAWINSTSSVQFMVDTLHFERSILTNKNNYYLDFTATQNINAPEDMYIVEEDPSTGEEIITNNMKCFIVLYQNGVPYRYAEGELTYADLTYYKYDWRFTFETSNIFDTNNHLMINGMYVANSRTKLYGYFPQNVEAYVYILAKSDIVGTDDRYDLDQVVSDGSGIPVLDGYAVTNKFEIHGGLNFFVDYSGILNSTITARKNPESETSNIYNLQGIPVIGYNYVIDEDTGYSNFLEFLNTMDEKKTYIDNAIMLLENSFDIDYKFYNTFGPSYLYFTEEWQLDGIVQNDEELQALIKYDDEGRVIFPAINAKYLVRNSSEGINIEFIFNGTSFEVATLYQLSSIMRVDINMNFTLSLKNSSDIYTKDNIIKYIKNYIENLSLTNQDVDISNMMSDIKVKFDSVINYIDYDGFNLFDSNRQHLYWRDPSDITVPPEFVNIRTIKNEVGEIVPDININVV